MNVGCKLSVAMAAFNEDDLEKHLGGEDDKSSATDFHARFGMSFMKRGDMKKAVQDSKAAKPKAVKKSIYVGDKEERSASESESDGEPDYGEEPEDAVGISVRTPRF
jgi:hypothetical protein